MGVFENGKENSLDVIVDEILNTYNHNAVNHLKFYEMFALVKEMMPEIDPNFKANDDEIERVILRFDLDGDGTYDRLEVENFVKNMLQYGWIEGQKHAIDK